MVQANPSPSEQESPYLPPGPPPLFFEKFQGINQNTSRAGVPDEQMSWCDGIMPISERFARVLPDVGPSIYAAPSNKTVLSYDFANIGATPYMILLLSDGSVQSVTTPAGTVKQIMPPGTIINPAQNAIAISQWGALYVIIVANQTNGYWLWNGTSLFGSGTLGPDVTLDNDGLDYTTQPTMVAYNGAGSVTGPTFMAKIMNGFIDNITVTNPGSGFAVTDAPYIAFSGGGSPGVTAIVSASISMGTLASLSIVNPGVGYTTSVTAQVLGGGGFGATVSITASGGSLSGASVVLGGDGYIAAPSIFVQDPGNPVAQALVDLMPTGIQGNTVETYQSRVWVANGPLVNFTAPESVSNFASADGGGSFTSFDSFLRVGFTRLIQTNGFLYLIADSSINYISGVQTSGNPIVTTFTNQNADPEIGTIWPNTVDVFSRNILFANAFGAHVSYGGAVTKFSELLDNVYSTVKNFGSFLPSAGKSIIFGKRVWMLLLPVIDPITGQQVNKLFMWNGKWWWTSQQSINLVFIQHQEINSVITCYGTDGKRVYPLFQQPSVGFTKTIQSKLWDAPGSYVMTKSASRVWGMALYYSSQAPTITISVDSEIGSSSTNLALGPLSVQFFNASGAVVPFTNAGGAPVTWFGSAPTAGVVVFPPQAVAQQGALLGLTMTTQAADMALISLALQPEIQAYRG